SANGSSLDVGTTDMSVGDFTTLLLSINPNLDPGGYPTDWTQYSVVLSGLPGLTTGRFAFRYFVTDGGIGGNNSNSIGVDLVQLDNGIPEPATFLLSAAGLLLLKKLRRR